MSDGSEVLAAVAAGEDPADRWDILLLDIQMIHVNGDAVCEALRARGCMLPIVAVTGAVGCVCVCVCGLQCWCVCVCMCVCAVVQMLVRSRDATAGVVPCGREYVRCLACGRARRREQGVLLWTS
jgi:hypothetical protein